MLKRRASVDLSIATLSPTKRPKLAPIVTSFERHSAPAIAIQDDSAPSPLDFPWMEWPWDHEDDVDSLFDELQGLSDADSLFDEPVASGVSQTPVDGSGALDVLAIPVASRTAPSIPGLHLDPIPALLLPAEYAASVLAQLQATYFAREDGPNQVMLFTRPTDALPTPLDSLLDTAGKLLRSSLPENVHDLLFAPRDDGSTRQAIVNRYAPGEGITSHVDLLRRYGDGIVGVSLGAGCAMAFSPAEGHITTSKPCELWLPERSVLALHGEARYDWAHGIVARPYDVVRREEGDGHERIDRGTRISVTFRWMLPGAHVVGED